MKESDSLDRSRKKTDGTSPCKQRLKQLCNKQHKLVVGREKDGPNPNKQRLRPKETKIIMGAVSSRKRSPNSGSNNKFSSPRKKDKKPQELRPRRRASQTYFFKYQLAGNPLKAEEEQLRLALLASLEDCGNGSASEKDIQEIKNGKKLLTSDVVKKEPKKSKKHIVQNHSVQSHEDEKHHSNNITVNNDDLNCSTSGSSNRCHHNNNITNNNNSTTSNNNGNPSIDNNSSSNNTIGNYDTRNYKPETEDFLTFICFRNTTPNFRNLPHLNTESPTSNGVTNGITHSTTKHITGNQINIIENSSNSCGSSGSKQVPNDHSNINNNHNNNCNLKLIPNCTSSNQRLICQVSSPTPSNLSNLMSPNNNRRPTRQSPRLASLSKRISHSNDNSSTYASNTAYDNLVHTYEEGVKQAELGLEDIKHEAADGIKTEFAQNSIDTISRLSVSPFKNNKHLVKGLMTREFAGAFADEDAIFENISNHKL